MPKAERESGPRTGFTRGGVMLQAVNAICAAVPSIVYLYNLPVNDFSGAAWLHRFDLPAIADLPEREIRILGISLIWATVCFMSWAMFSIGRVGSYGGLEVRERHKLCDSGAFAYVRHPIYLCSFALPMATILATWNWLSLIQLVGLLVSIPPKIPIEERTLEEKLGDKWRQYCQRVPYRLFPFVY